MRPGNGGVVVRMVKGRPRMMSMRSDLVVEVLYSTMEGADGEGGGDC